MDRIGGQFSDIVFHTSSTQHQWGKKSNHKGRSHPHNLVETGLTVTKRKRWKRLHTRKIHSHYGDNWRPILYYKLPHKLNLISMG